MLVYQNSSEFDQYLRTMPAYTHKDMSIEKGSQCSLKIPEEEEGNYDSDVAMSHAIPLRWRILQVRWEADEGDNNADNDKLGICSVIS